VVQAVSLEETSGLKGPRILLPESLARNAPAPLREWLLRPTAAPGVWEILWLLPSKPSEVADYEEEIRSVCATALELFPLAGHPTAGAHYREFLTLVARGLERLGEFAREGRLRLSVPLHDFLPAGMVKAVVSTTSGLPDGCAHYVMALVETLNTQ
jgi:hypothetical protein